MIRLEWALCAALALAGCKTDQPFDPTAGRDAGTDQGGQDTSEVPGDAGPDVPEDAPEPDTSPMGTCTTDDDCGGEKACVTGACGDDGYCVWSVAEGFCLVNNVCWAVGAANPGSGCEVCDPGADAQGWTAKANGAACSADVCLGDGTCEDGVCAGGAPIDCADEDPCTDDSCDPATGCVHRMSNEARACDDGDACTANDTCSADGCAGTPLDCGDDNGCTDDRCDPETGACENAPNTAPCSDGSACTEGDTCAGGECVPGAPPNCDDGNICTIDGCNDLAGCYYLPTQSPCCIGENSVCDDGNPCTSDLCDPEGGDCIYEFNSARCDDQTVCTMADRCEEGRCGGVPVVCEDGNGCTADSCDPVRGCQARPLDGGDCDDGIECTTAEVCVQGVCQGNDDACTCVPEFSPVANRMNTVQLGTNGRAGQGLDVDGDAQTCSPANDCGGGIDNALGVLAGIVNPPLADSVEMGSVNLILEFTGYGQNPFSLALHQAGLDPGNPACNVQSQTCNWRVTDDLLDPDTCDRIVTLDARLDGNRLTAGGPGTRFPFSLPIGDAVIELTLYEVQLQGTVSERNGRVASMSVVLGGAVRRGELIDALGALDPDSLPVPPEVIGRILNSVVFDDVDTNGDGQPDAASIGIRLDGIQANIVGVQ